MTSLLLLLFLLTAEVAPHSGARLQKSDSLPRIHARDGWLVDPDRRVRLFHGFNSVLKGAPWYDAQILNETRLELMRSWGFNVVRLGAMWAGCEPVEGRYDTAYLSTLQHIVERLEAHGMHIILDMHQDVLSSKFDAYDGVPRWLVDKFPDAAHRYPWPLHNISGKYWAEGYLTQAVSLAFQQIYDNVFGAADSFAGFWKRMASTFGARGSVLGYELINEPWAGDIYRDPSLLLPGESGRKNLAPLYDRLSAAIRSVDNDTLIFYEPVTWAVFLDTADMGTGFTAVPGGAAYRNRSVLSYHYYCWIIDIDALAAPYALWERVVCDALLGPRVIPTVLQEVSVLGGSAFLTEFGLCAPDGNPRSVNTVECEYVLAQADKYLQSWTYWDSEFFNRSTGAPILDTVRAFARVYVRAVAGEPLAMSFSLADKLFLLQYRLDASISQPTEVFVPMIHYPTGFKVALSDALTWKFDAQASVVYVTHVSGMPSQDVFFQLRPA